MKKPTQRVYPDKKPTLTTVTPTPPGSEQTETAPVTRNRQRLMLNANLQRSLELEADMQALQKEFMRKSNRISRHIDQLGLLLKSQRAA